MKTKGIAIVEISGGLGNQLFQLGAAQLLRRNFETVYLDFSANLINPKRRNEIMDLAKALDFPFIENSVMLRKIFAKLRLTQIEHHFRREKLVIEKKSFSKPIADNSKRRVRFRGYWQNIECANAIRHEVKSWIKVFPQDSIGLHIRRGDYTIEENSKHHGLLTDEYFSSILENFENDSSLMIYSDSPIQIAKMGFVQSNFRVKESVAKEPWETLALLSAHKVIVISNSTFSWWAAFLSDAEIVYFPSEWMPNKPTPPELLLDRIIVCQSIFA
jgi:hypothetical protein